MIKEEMLKQIERLKHEKNAIILAHNYQSVDVQALADYRGDSLQLSITASEARADIIVFCGVRFMAETAAILNPSAKVLLPAADAGCPMADMINVEQLREFKQYYPGAVVVCYVNSSVEVKAESDVCCTSSNAVEIVNSIPKDREIIFVPDQNLGSWTARQTGRKIITWDGYCPIHHLRLTLEDVAKMRALYPDYTLIAHPECIPDVLDKADHVMSTSGMMDYVHANDKVIIATEHAMINYLQYLYPEKHIVALNPEAICKNMKKTSLEDVLQALQHEQHLITVDPQTAQAALRSLQRMVNSDWQ
ncbi:MAG: quinolinate synthase [Candidatus Cloacimonetes bacterium HGW-Cloacimonetes-1]|jgi:quinolinate synthase|nr:MAG: quinolinate synthase [Candidatus Cloacimonetes bacterium HGW-Cloacimonetes-1]